MYQKTYSSPILLFIIWRLNGLWAPHWASGTTFCSQNLFGAKLNLIALKWWNVADDSAIGILTVPVCKKNNNEISNWTVSTLKLRKCWLKCKCPFLWLDIRSAPLCFPGSPPQCRHIICSAFIFQSPQILSFYVSTGCRRILQVT